MRATHTITLYDFADLCYSSYFLVGLFANERAGRVRVVVSKRVPPLVRDLGLSEKWRQILPSICIGRSTGPAGDTYFCIDGRDGNDSREPTLGYALPLLPHVKHYFKVNYNRDAIAADPEIRDHQAKIIPVPLAFPLRPARLHTLRPRIRPAAEMNWSSAQVARRLKTLQTLPSPADMTSWRNGPKDLDLFFVHRYYEEAEHVQDNAFRLNIVRAIRKRTDLKTVVGFASLDPLPYPYSDYQLPVTQLREYLKTMARAKVGIYVRGLFECSSFKLGQLLALGKPMVGQSLHNNAEVFSSHSHLAEQLAFGDPETIVERAVELARDPEKRARWGQANLASYQNFFAPQIVTAQMIDRLEG